MSFYVNDKRARHQTKMNVIYYDSAVVSTLWTTVWCSVLSHFPCSVIFREPGYCTTRRRFSEIWKRHKTTATFIFSLFFAFSVNSSSYTFFCLFSPLFLLSLFLLLLSSFLFFTSLLTPVVSSRFILPLHFHHDSLPFPSSSVLFLFDSLPFPSSSVLFLFYLFSSFLKSLQQCLQVNQFLSARRRQIRVLQAGREELNKHCVITLGKSFLDLA
jgi:hypothetical protein